MNQSVRLVLAALSSAALLGACDRGITESRSAEDVEIRVNLPPPDDPGDGGGGGGGGGTAVEPFNPPPRPYFQAPNLPTYSGGVIGTLYSCGQVTHAFWGLGSTFNNDITVGTTIYVSGIVVPGTQMNWGIYDRFGNQVMTHLTQPARSNCVVHHEPEAISTSSMAPGYYYLYASYNGLTNYTPQQTSAGYTTPFGGTYVGVFRLR
ncbi:MAG TPA: hypothetical protein VF613_19790 [Longimicrobium sp.]|jgi:hypothetical protein